MSASPAAPDRLTPARAADWLRRPTPDDHKYSRGVLGLRTGSNAYPGAAVLGATAAMRTGLGMLRYVPPVDDPQAGYAGVPAPAALVLAAHPEAVLGSPAEDGHPCDAWVIGSGTDAQHRSPAERAELLRLLSGDAPVVADAGALGLILSRGADGAPAILTPHRGEFGRLWRAADLGEPPSGSAEACRRLAERLSCTVLLKGSVTTVATPGGCVRTAGPATPWLATAGTGDVLAGVLGAMLAAHAAAVRDDPERLGELGAAAAVLHDAAARIAARRAAEGARGSAGSGSAGSRSAGSAVRASGPAGSIPAESVPAESAPAEGPVTAGDVAEALPEAVAALLAAGER